MAGKRKLRKRVHLLELVAVELTERIEQLEGGADTSKWRDCYSLDLDPSAPISDELQDRGPLPGYVWDDDDWRRGSYL